VTVRQGRKKRRRKRKGGEKKRKEKKRGYPVSLFMFFLLFLRASKILIFIKNNMENTKYILTVRSNSV